MIDLRALRSFLVLSEVLHFGRAARRLNVVQPALSMQIKALEAAVGAPLFARTSRRVALTPVGDLLRVEARKLLAQADHTLTTVARAAKGLTGRVVIGFAGTASLLETLPSDLAAFRAARPDVEVELRETRPEAQLRALCDGTIDVGYCPDLSLDVPDEIVGMALGRWSWRVAVAAGSALSHKLHLAGDDLLGEPVIAYEGDEDAEGQRRILRRVLGAEPAIVHRAGNTLAVLAMVAAGMGIAVVPGPLAALSLPGLAFRPLVDDPETEVLLLSRRSDPSPAVAGYVDGVRRRLPRSGVRAGGG